MNQLFGAAIGNRHHVYSV